MSVGDSLDGVVTGRYVVTSKTAAPNCTVYHLTHDVECMKQKTEIIFTNRTIFVGNKKEIMGHNLFLESTLEENNEENNGRMVRKWEV